MLYFGGPPCRRISKGAIGALLVFGFLTRPIVLLFVIELLVFIFGVHIDKGWLWNRGGVQYPLFGREF